MGASRGMLEGEQAAMAGAGAVSATSATMLTTRQKGLDREARLIIASGVHRITRKALDHRRSHTSRKAHRVRSFLLSGPTAEDIRRTPGLRLVAPLLGIFWLDFPDQWDPKSPWADRRVRLAASLAIDRQALNQAETLGLSRPTGSLVPRDFEFALRIDAPAFDPKRAHAIPGFYMSPYEDLKLKKP